MSVEQYGAGLLAEVREEGLDEVSESTLEIIPPLEPAALSYNHSPMI